MGWHELHALAVTQHGLVATWQARRLGVPPTTLRRRVNDEGGTSIERGVWLLPGHPRTPVTSAMAAVLAARPPVAATGVTALHLHGVLGRPNRTVQLVVPRHRAAPTLRTDSDVVRSGVLGAADVQAVAGVPTLPVAWCLLHAGRVVPAGQVEQWTITARQRRLVTDDELRAVLEAAGHQAGVASLRAAWRTCVEDAVDSVLERDARRLLLRAGVPLHAGPFPFRCPDGRVIHLDLAAPTVWSAWECDSPDSRAGGRAFQVDRTRWGQVTLGGWQLDWITRQRLRTDPRGILEQARHRIATADPGRPAARATPCRSRRCHVCQPLRGPASAERR